MAIALQLQNNKFLHNEKIEITTIVKLALWPYITQKHKIRAETIYDQCNTFIT